MKSKTIIVILLFLLVTVFGLLGWRIFYLQRFQSDRYRHDSQRQRHAVIYEIPRRGDILDRRGRILAASNKIESVFAEPRQFESDDETKLAASGLQNTLNLPANIICGLIYDSQNPGFVKIMDNLQPNQRDAVNQANLKGIGIQSCWKRYYPMGALTGHVIGFIGTEQTGLAGIETKYDSILSGSKGSDVLLVDALRRPIGLDTADSRMVTDGAGLVLTIDSTIQQFAKVALSKQITEFEAQSGVVIVMEPHTGAILAMVSLPDFDPYSFNIADADVLRNRAITDPYEPGSIFKPIVAAAAIDFGVIGRDELIFCENGYFSKYRIGEYGNHQYGNLTVRGILLNSSNIGMAKIGLKMGKEKLYEGVRLFGFGAKTGIDLPGEDSGILRPLSQWSGYSPTRIPFGHEISVTAIQIARAYCILANGGKSVKPHLVQVKLNDDGILESLAPKASAGFVIKPETAKWIVTEALTAVVEEGTGKKVAIENVKVFGKTGTANIASSDRKGYDQRNYIASFVGGAPADDPRIIILVSIYKPNRTLGKGYTGGTVAGPVFREILQKTLTYLDWD